MSVIIDASMLSGLPSGPVTFSAGVNAAWTALAVDELTIWDPVLGSSTPTRLARHLLRPPGAFVGATAYLSPNPTLPLALPAGVRSGVVVHDLRHEEEPGSFSTMSRAYRRQLWARGIEHADVVFTVSEPTRALVAHRFGVEAITIPMGVDHMADAGSLRWPSGDESNRILAMCHRENKPPELAIEAWRFARDLLDGDIPDLKIIGLEQSKRDELEQSTPEVAIGRIELHGRLPGDRFRRSFAGAAALLFLSTHEGFGLPVAEARALGVPFVATELSSIRDIVGPDHSLAVTNDPPIAGSLLAEVVRGERPAPLRSSTWEDTVKVIRDALLPTPILLSGRPSRATR